MDVTSRQVHLWLTETPGMDMPRPLCIRSYRRVYPRDSKEFYVADFSRPLMVIPLSREEKVLATYLAITPNGQTWLVEYGKTHARADHPEDCPCNECCTAQNASI